MSDKPPDAESGRREACYVRARRPLSWRAVIVYEAVTRRDGRNQILSQSERVPADSEEAEAALDQLIRQLFREGWVPTPEPLFIGEDVLGVYVRRPR
jgi:hypothetical protein